MNDTTSVPADAAAPEPQGPAARFFGILFSPRATYGNVAAHPRWIAMFLLVLVISSAVSAGLMATDVGRRAVVDQQISQSEAFGRPMNDQQIDMLEKMSGYYVYFSPLISFVGLTFGSLIVSGLLFAIFNALMGGDATFKQTFAVVVHSGVILTTARLFTTPLAYARESLASSTNLAIFLPFLDETSFAAHALGSIDLVYIWWMVSVAIGLGVLYRRRTAPIAMTLLGVYVAIGLIVAGVRTIGA
jgi:Yip1 domain